MEEEAKPVKKASQYCYFAASIDPSVPSKPPQLITEAKAAAEAAALAERQKQEGISAWNRAGTFEERDRTAWAKELLGTTLLGSCGSGSGGLCVTEVKDITGSANTWIVRGKKRHGFDLALTLAWELTTGAAVTQGVAKVPNAASDELDELQVELLGSKSEAITFPPAVSKQVKGQLPAHVEKVLQALLKELQQKM